MIEVGAKVSEVCSFICAIISFEILPMLLEIV